MSSSSVLRSFEADHPPPGRSPYRQVISTLEGITKIAHIDKEALSEVLAEEPGVTSESYNNAAIPQNHVTAPNAPSEPVRVVPWAPEDAMKHNYHRDIKQ